VLRTPTRFQMATTCRPSPHRRRHPRRRPEPPDDRQARGGRCPAPAADASRHQAASATSSACRWCRPDLPSSEKPMTRAPDSPAARRENRRDSAAVRQFHIAGRADEFSKDRVGDCGLIHPETSDGRMVRGPFLWIVAVRPHEELAARQPDHTALRPRNISTTRSRYGGGAGAAIWRTIILLSQTSRRDRSPWKIPPENLKPPAL
jgi:hypothetical protein